MFSAPILKLFKAEVSNKIVGSYPKLARRVLTTLRRLELLRTGLVWAFVLPIWELLLIYFLTKSVVRKQKLEIGRANSYGFGLM